MSKVRFGDVVCEIKHNIDRSNNPYDYYVAGDHMDSNDLTIHRKGRFDTDDVGPAFVREFKAGQILYGSRRTYLKKVAVSDFDGITANTTFVLETKDSNILLQSLLPFVMLSDSFTEWSVKKSKGSTNPYVLFSDLADYEFELPTIEEQEKLSHVLWAAFRLREKYESLIKQADELVKSQFVEMFGDFKSNPRNLPVVNIEDLFEVGSSKRIMQKDWKTEGVPFYRAREIVKLSEDGSVDNELFITEEMYKEYSSKYGTPVAGDIMVTGVGTLGVCYLVKESDRFYYKDGNTLCFHNKGSVDSRFILECYKMPFIKEQIDANAGGTTVGTYTIVNAKKTKVFYPPMDEQKKFVELVKQIDKSKLAIRQSLDSLEKSRNAIMKSIFG